MTQPAQAPVFGQTKLNMNIPADHAIIIRRSDGSTSILKYLAAEIVVAPILEFRGYFQLRGASIPFHCEVIPKAMAGMTSKQFPRELADDLKQAIEKELSATVQKLLIEQTGRPHLVMELNYNQADYTCQVKLTNSVKSLG